MPDLLYGYPLLPGYLPDRPMWKMGNAPNFGFRVFTRLDGRSVTEAGLLAGIGVVPGLIHLDVNAVVPPPPPLVGQVWLLGPYYMRSVTVVEVDHGEAFAVCCGAVDPFRPDPSQDVLVAGPSCYGRDVVWHPPTWVAP